MCQCHVAVLLLCCCAAAAVLLLLGCCCARAAAAAVLLLCFIPLLITALPFTVGCIMSILNSRIREDRRKQ